MAYDLHIHTCWSYDSTVEPEVYFRRAAELGVRCISFTEHGNIDSLEEAFILARKFPDIKFIPGAELTVRTSISSADLVCYNIPRQPGEELAGILLRYRKRQEEAGRAASEGMQKLGFPYTDAERLGLLRSYRPERVLAKQGPTRVMNRAQREHFILRGYIAGQEDYGPTIIKAVGDLAVPSAGKVVPALKKAGALVVIAHPAGAFHNDDIRRMDVLREECMLDGIECASWKIHPRLTKLYRKYCIEHGLISTAGSDSHFMEQVISGAVKREYTEEARFASHAGEDRWLAEFLERLGREEPGE